MKSKSRGIGNRLLNINIRLLSAIIVFALLLSSVGILFTTQAYRDESVLNYPTIRSYETDALSTGIWSYSAAEFGAKPSFNISSGNYSAPKARWDANDCKAIVSWAVVDTAGSYTLVICKGTTAVITETVSVNSWESNMGQLEAGETYEIQVTAKSGDNVLAASDICVFKAEATEEPFNLTEILGFGNETDLSYVARGTFAAAAIENNALKLSTSSRANANFVLSKAVAAGNAEAMVFYLKAPEMLATFEVYVNSTASGSSKTNAIFVSATDSSKTQSVEIKSSGSKRNFRLTDTTVAGDANGYYVIIPLSAYSDEQQTLLKNGTYTNIKFVLSALRYKDATTGKYATSNQNFNGSPIYFDEFAFVSSADEFIQSLTADNSGSKEDTQVTYEFTGENETFNALTLNSQKTELVSDTIGTGYKFDIAKQEITFNAVTSGSRNYGAILAFSAPEAALYDLTAALYVTGNSEVNDATIYYRVSVEKAGEKIQLWPESTQQWAELMVNANDLNPKADFPLVQQYLAKGEKIILEAYAETAITFSFGNPTTTVVQQSETYKGETTVYPFSAYAPNAIYDVSMISAGNYTAMNSRFTSKLLHIVDGVAEYSDFTVCRPSSSYECIMSAVNIDQNTNKNIGYYNYLTAKTAGKMKFLNIGKNYGVAYQFVSAQSGNAVVTFTTGAFSEDIKVRVLKNGNKIFPQDKDWADGTKDTLFYADAIMDKGDLISVEFFSESDTLNSNSYLKDTIKVILQENSSNQASSNVFSPLWERPYKNKQYSGSFSKLDGSVWDFNILQVSNKTTIATDYYVTGKNLLYNEAITNKYAYIFGKEQMKVQLAGEEVNYGISLSFTAPERAYYDISTAINVISGSGTLSARILHNDIVVWGDNGDWLNTTDTQVQVPAIELGALAGDTITLQLYANSKMTVGLGTPIIHKLNNKIQTETGNINVYVPGSYTAFEDRYNGKHIPINSRFNYQFVTSKGVVLPIDFAISSENKLIANENNSVVFENGGSEFSINAADSNTARIEFVSPMTASGEFTYNISNLPSGAKIKVVQGGKLLKTVEQATSGEIKLAITKGETVALEITGLNGQTAVFNSLNISLIGYHNNNTEADDAFYAGLADPYPISDYTGKYEMTDTDFWEFGFYNIATGNIEYANYYANKKLYSTEAENAAYYFENKLLTAEISEKYGLSLGFIAPRNDTFNVRYGLTLETKDITSKLFVRIIKISADGKNTTQVWPEKDWYTKAVSEREPVTIPYAEIQANKGEKILYQVYAENENNDIVKVNLASPAIIAEKPISIFETDFSAEIYNAFDYFTYSHVDGYDGKYYPMENRWNFKFADITNLDNIKVFDPDKLRTDLNFDYMYSKEHGSRPQYRFNPNTNQIDVRGDITKDRNISSVIQYVSATSGDVKVNAAPTVDLITVNGVIAKYRVLLTSVKDGKTSTVWPLNGSWEILSNEKKTSECIGLDLNLAVGDKLAFELYWDVPEAELDKYLAQQNEDAQYWVPEYAIKPMVVKYTAIDENKTAFSATNQFVRQYLVSPYWRVQYATDSNNPKWSNATLYRWVYWLNPSENYMGINTSGVYWMQNFESSLDTVKSPALAWLFSVRKDGVIQMSSTKKIQFPATSDQNYDAELRITVNNKNVWPESGWNTLNHDEVLKLEDVSFEVKAGDEVRFEVRSKQKIISDGKDRNDEFKLIWDPAFILSAGSVYSQTDDIYNMLDEEMFAFFKTLSNMSEFDEDFEANRILSKQIKAYKDSLNQQGDGQTTVRVVYVWWVYALIIGGAVVAAAGITLLVIILVKKKKSQPINQNIQ